MKKTIFTCDNTPCTARAEQTQLPDDWVEPGLFGTILGTFCPACAKTVTLARAVDLCKARRP